MIGETEDMDRYLRQFDREMRDNGVPAMQGVIIGSGALAHHIESTGEELPFPITDLDIYTQDGIFIEEMSKLPYGTKFEGRRFGGGAYVLGDERESLPDTMNKWDINSGCLSEGPVIDFLTLMDSPDVEWALRAELENNQGDPVNLDHNKIAYVSLPTYAKTKRDPDREKDSQHRYFLRGLVREGEWNEDEFDIEGTDYSQVEGDVDYSQVRENQFDNEF